MTEIVDKSFKLVKVKHKKLHPVTITDDFVTLFGFHHAEVEKVVKGKTGTAKMVKRYPVIFIWDGKEISYTKAEKDDKIIIKDQEYVIDREVDDLYKFLPSEPFLTSMLHRGFIDTIKKFEPDDLFDEVFEFFEHHFYMESQMLYKVVALFAINQCVFDAYDSTPYLFIRSPLEECGKTRLGISIQSMWNGILSTNIKAHHVFRIVDGCSPTFIFDEAKGWSKRAFTDEKIQDMLAVINSGYQREGGQVIRFKEKGGQFGNMQAIIFQSYSPKAIITTHLSIPRDTQSRCIEIQMQRAPKDGPDYEDRWNRKKDKKSKVKERVEKLNRIREMAALFRFKCGREIKNLAEGYKWREELDHTGEFEGIRNRHLELFKPLIVLCLKYKPEWTDLLAKYIREFIEMREATTHSPENTVLYALRKIWQMIEKNDYWIDEDTQIEFEDTEVDGQIFWVSAKMIRAVIEEYGIGNIEEFGTKNVESKIGRILSEFGFHGTERTKKGNLRRIKTSRLAERCLNYLGIRMAEDYELSMQERVDLIKRILNREGEMDFDDLMEEVTGKITETYLIADLKHLREDGTITTSSTEGKGMIQWLG